MKAHSLLGARVISHIHVGVVLNHEYIPCIP
jgi:hypothetical protein